MLAKGFHIRVMLFGLLGLVSFNICSGQILSQYVDTDSGTTPKGIEIWNNTSNSIDFSVNNLFIEKGTNGSTPSLDFTIDSGVLQPDEVLIVGTIDMQAAATSNGVLFFEKSFTFNGDDALVLKLGTTITDVFGDPGNDPGTDWAGNGVSTSNSNIALLSGINTGELVGFTDPSTRFETVNTSPSDIANGGLDGFGIAPTPLGPILSVSPTTITGLNYIEDAGPSNPQSFEVSGSNLDGSDVTITSPVNFEISETQTGTYTNSIILNAYNGSPTNIWVRLKENLLFGGYNGEITISGGGATPIDVTLNGNVTGQVIVQQDFDGSIPEWNYTNDVTFFDNGWGSGFYGLIDSSSASPLDNPNFSGNILGENDLQDTPDGTTGVATLTFENINISGYTNVQLSFDYQFENYNANNDEGSYEILEDEIGQGQVFLADGSNPSSENTSGAETISITPNVNEVSLNYMLENDGATGYSGFDNLILTGLANDTTTDINPPTTQVPAGEIIVDEAINATNSVPVFKFDVEDIGGDSLDTELSHVRVIPGQNNTANWSEVIAGVRLEGGGLNVNQGDQNLTITDNELIIEVTAIGDSEMIVPDDSSKEYTINIFIDPDFADEGEIIQMAIDDGNDNFFVNPNGSMVSRNITGFEGNEHNIEIEGNKLEFIVNPATTIINEPMGTVQVAYTDDEGQIDTDFTAQVSISSSGVLTGDPVSVNAIDGVASFSNLEHTALGSNLTFTASSDGETDIVSSNFNIISLPELFITEVADPGDDFQARFIEIYNAGTTPIDFDEADYYIIREANVDDFYNSNKLEGTIQSKSYYIISSESESDFGDLYGINSDLQGNTFGNGNDTYSISRQSNGINSSEQDLLGINSQFDIYGEFGINGFTGDSSNASINDFTNDDTDWEYEDSRAYRNNPTVKNANTTWTASEWTIENNADIADITPGYGDNDYIYVDDTDEWDNIGLGNPNDTPPTSAQNIFVRSGTAILIQDISIGDLVVRSGATLELEPGVKLTVDGDIVNEGTIIFKSNDTSTAVLEAVDDTEPNVTRVVGDGFEIHRYIPNSNRAFRYLAPSVSTNNSSKPSIRDNWQEGVNNTSQLDTDNQNPDPGFGTHITGSTDGSLGFDATQTGNPSMFGWNESTQDWDDIPNTNSKPLNVGESYAILIRGDRGTTLNSNTALGDPTILRTTGEIHVRDFNVDDVNLTPSTNPEGVFNLVGNPYQSQVDLKDLLDNYTTDIDESEAFIYDPTLGEKGGYATLDLTNLTFSSVPTGTNANQYLQPNQAFFVKSNGTSPSITFNESTKNNDENQVETFSESENALPTHININLVDENNKLTDGVRIVYDNEFSSTINQYDADKAWNFDESLAIYSNQSYLSIEKRNLPDVSDTTQLQLYNYTKNNYSLNLDYKINESINVDVFLLDQYTQNTVEILPNQITNYNFSVDPNIPESLAYDRFEIVYDNSTLSNNQFNSTNFSIYPNPLNSNESLYIQSEAELISNIEGVELLNLNGQILEEIPSTLLDFSNNLVKISFNRNISSGPYLLKIMTTQKVSIHKIIFK